MSVKGLAEMWEIASSFLLAMTGAYTRRLKIIVNHSITQIIVQTSLLHGF